MMTIDDLIERFDGSLAYSTNSKEICQYIADLLKELKERRKAPEIVRCEDCKWWTKQKDSGQGRCELLGIYPTGGWYCANGAEERTDG
jgi:hypothetical protein